MRGNLHFKDGIDDWKRKYDQVQQEGKSMRDHLDGRLMQDLAECYAVAKRRRTCGKVPAFAARLLIDVSAGKARGERAPEGADPFSGGQICPRSKTDVGDLVAFRYLVAGPGLEDSLSRHLARRDSDSGRRDFHDELNGLGLSPARSSGAGAGADLDWAGAWAGRAFSWRFEREGRGGKGI